MQREPTRLTVGQFLFLSLLVVGAAVCLAVFGSGSNFGGGHTYTWGSNEPPTARLAEALLKIEQAPEITDEAIQGIVSVLMNRAAQGDIEAATFVVELAARQRAAKQAAEHTETKETRLAQSEQR